MQVRYFATIREYTHEQARPWTQPAATLRELLEALAARYESAFRKAVLSPDGSDLSPIVIILVNGQDVRHLSGIDTPLKPEDAVAIFPMVAGG